MVTKGSPEEKLFVELADKQRGRPEMAMLKVQEKMGGGVLSPVVEHSGDLIHRISEIDAGFDGTEYFKEKVNRVHKYLSSGYGFEREMIQNIATNASSRGVPNQILRTEIDTALKKFADEHAKLPAYNDLHKLINDANVAIGNQDWDLARQYYDTLKEIASLPDEEIFKLSKEIDPKYFNQAPQENSIEGWHGGADFDAFSDEKIGTSSGNAEGWGHYIAKTDRIPKTYQTKYRQVGGTDASVDITFAKSGEKVGPDNPGYSLIADYVKRNGARFNTADRSYLKEDLENRLDGILDYHERNKADLETLKKEYPDDYSDYLQKTREKINKYESAINLVDKIDIKPIGRLYKVKIDATRDDFLSWDESLSKQSNKLKDAITKLRKENPDLEKALIRMANDAGRNRSIEDLKGSDLYRALYLTTFSPQKASKVLEKEGVKGSLINNTNLPFNNDDDEFYVIFNADFIKIIEKYGIASLIAAGVITKEVADKYEQMQKET